jgi:hypothetical protein
VFEKRLEAQKIRIANRELSKISLAQRQVAHDIRSPLAALNVIKDEFSILPENTRIILRSAIGRITDIASILLNKASQTSSAVRNVLITSIIEEVVSEKRIEYVNKPNVAIEFFAPEKTYGIFSKINTVEFKRAISNIINNSVQALRDEGTVQIHLKIQTDFILLSIIDNGCGIRAEDLERLGKKDFTTKKDGHGLGIFHARSTIEEHGGDLKFRSKVGEGTSVDIYLPRSSTPRWFIPYIPISKGLEVIIVDDDPSIHQVWNMRLLDFECVVRHCYDYKDLLDYLSISTSSITQKTFLVDYEFLGSAKTGLDMIVEFGIIQDSILVTTHYEEDKVLSQCSEIGVKLIPKNLAAIVPIKLQSEVNSLQ